MTRHLNDDACIDILSGALSREQAGELLDHTRACPQCEARFRAAAAEYETLSAQAADTLANPAEPPAIALAPRGRRVRRVRRIVAAAGVVAAAAAAVVLLLPKGPGAPPEYWLPAARESIDIRSLPDSGEEQLTDGLAAYDARRLDAALAALATARVSGPFEDIRRIYLASALAIDGRPDEALPVLDGVEVDALPQPWRSQAHWIRALALDASGREEDAVVLLEMLAAGDGDLAGRAAARLRELRSR